MSTTKQKRKQPVATVDPDKDGDIAMAASGGGGGGDGDAQMVPTKKQKIATKIGEIIREHEAKGVFRRAALEAMEKYSEEPHIDGVQKFHVEVNFAPLEYLYWAPDLAECMDEMRLFGPGNGSREVSKIVMQYAQVPSCVTHIRADHDLMASKTVRKNLIDAMESGFFGEGTTCTPIKHVALQTENEDDPLVIDRLRRIFEFKFANNELSCPFVYQVDFEEIEPIRVKPGRDERYVRFRVGDVTRALCLDVFLGVLAFKEFSGWASEQPRPERTVWKDQLPIVVWKDPIPDDTRDLAGAREMDFVQSRFSDGSVSASLKMWRFWRDESDHLPDESPAICIKREDVDNRHDRIRFYIPIPQGIVERMKVAACELAELSSTSL